MKVLKFKVFTEQGFIDWQLEDKREINMVSPMLNGITGDVSEHGSVGMDTHVSVFVLYWEEAQQVIQPDNAQ